MSETQTPDQLVADAKGLYSLGQKAITSPELQTALTTLVSQFVANRSLLGTKTFWVTLISPLVSGAVAHFGFQLDDATVGEISTGTVMVAAWIMRRISGTPVQNILPSSSK